MATRSSRAAARPWAAASSTAARPFPHRWAPTSSRSFPRGGPRRGARRAARGAGRWADRRLRDPRRRWGSSARTGSPPRSPGRTARRTAGSTSARDSTPKISSRFLASGREIFRPTAASGLGALLGKAGDGLHQGGAGDDAITTPGGRDLLLGVAGEGGLGSDLDGGDEGSFDAIVLGHAGAARTQEDRASIVAPAGTLNGAARGRRSRDPVSSLPSGRATSCAGGVVLPAGGVPPRPNGGGYRPCRGSHPGGPRSPPEARTRPRRPAGLQGDGPATPSA